MIVCPKCEYDNELGRIFCHSCGAKLDLSKIKAPTEGAKMRRKMKRSASKSVRIVIELTITAVLVVCIWLMCLTPEVKPANPSVAEADVVEKKREQLESLVERSKPGSVVISEAELNTFLSANGFEKKKPGDGIEVSPVALHAILQDHSVKMEFLGTIHFTTSFEKGIYLAYEGVPTLEGGHFKFNATGGWLGKLPIHPWLLHKTGLFDNYMGRLMANMDAERQILEKLTAIRVTPKSVELVKETTPAHAAP